MSEPTEVEADLPEIDPAVWAAMLRQARGAAIDRTVVRVQQLIIETFGDDYQAGLIVLGLVWGYASLAVGKDNSHATVITPVVNVFNNLISHYDVEGMTKQ